MNELSRHIEILLLDNDCVIVPGFGGFVAHHRAAEFVEANGMFYPPQRTLGFNSQLTLNDSLLAQSYVEAYDLSYPEAVQRIESETEEIKQIITIEGEYEFHGIGIIRKGSNEIYEFEPCTAGLLTPELYALNSFSLDMLETTSRKVEQTEVEKIVETPILELNSNSEFKEEVTAWPIQTLRTVAASILLLLLFTFSSLPVGIGSNKVIKCAVIDTDFITSFIKNNTFSDNSASVKTTLEMPCENKDSAKAESIVSTTEKPTIKKEADRYVIILASKVSRAGAEAFIASLSKQGYSEASLSNNNNIRKVIYGAYPTSEEANAALRQLKEANKAFADGWVCKAN